MLHSDGVPLKQTHAKDIFLKSEIYTIFSKGKDIEKHTSKHQFVSLIYPLNSQRLLLSMLT